MKQVYGVWLPKDDTHFENGFMHPNGDYQRDTFQVAMSCVKEPKVFYDIGAHVGLWSMMAFRAGFKQIHAYEPNPKTFECLQRNMQIIDSGCYVNLNPYGVGTEDDRTGIGYFNIIENDKNNSGAVSLKVIVNQKGTIPVCDISNNEEIFKMIQLYQPKPHETFVKIDTEGMEAECVLGMDKIIYALRPVVCVEQRTNEDALKILQQMGMIIQKKVRKDWILTWKNQ